MSEQQSAPPSAESKSVKNRLSSLRKSMQEGIDRYSKKAVTSMNEALDETSKTFQESVSFIDQKTRREQLELLKSYLSLLKSQEEAISRRIQTIEQAKNQTTLLQEQNGQG